MKTVAVCGAICLNVSGNAGSQHNTGSFRQLLLWDSASVGGVVGEWRVACLRPCRMKGARLVPPKSTMATFALGIAAPLARVLTHSQGISSLALACRAVHAFTRQENSIDGAGIVPIAR